MATVSASAASFLAPPSIQGQGATTQAPTLPPCSPSLGLRCPRVKTARSVPLHAVSPRARYYALGAIQDSAEGALGGAQEAGEEAQAKGAQAWDEGKDRLSEASENLLSKGKQAWDEASNRIGEASETAEETGEEAWEGAKNSAGDAAEGVQSAASESSEYSKKQLSELESEAGEENLRTAVSGDVKGWTASGDITPEAAEKAGKSEGEIIAARLIGRAEKGT